MYCKHCGKELKKGIRFCPNCGKPVEDASGMKQKIGKSGKNSDEKKTSQKGGKWKWSVVVMLGICIVAYVSYFFTNADIKDKGIDLEEDSLYTDYSEENLIGTWIAPGTTNQKLEIRTEEIRFNGRTFDYIVDGNVLVLEETYPNASLRGEMPFELQGDILTIDLGTKFKGFFYGRKGKVKLEKSDTED